MYVSFAFHAYIFYREKKCTESSRAIPTTIAYFGEGSGPSHLSRAERRRNDARLTDCTINKTGINIDAHTVKTQESLVHQVW
jgi:hypothetical protein